MAEDGLGRLNLLFDLHADSLGKALAGRDLGRFDPDGQWDFPRRAVLGPGVQVFSCWVEPEYKPDRALARLLAYIDQFWLEMDRHRRYVFPVTSPKRLHTVFGERERFGAILSVEGAEGIGADPARVRLLYRLGVRIMSLTWNERNQLADGAGEEPGAGGLSRTGRKMVAEMARVNMTVDVSHLSRAGFWDVLEMVPPGGVIATHSNCAALTPHARNLSDDQIRNLVRHGGVQGVTFVPAFLGGARDQDRVIDHLAHHLDLVGTDTHLGLGSDFDGVEERVLGVETVSTLPRLAERMQTRGFRDDTIARIFGANLLKYFLDAWDERSRPLTWQMASAESQEGEHEG